MKWIPAAIVFPIAIITIILYVRAVDKAINADDEPRVKKLLVAVLMALVLEFGAAITAVLLKVP